MSDHHTSKTIRSPQPETVRDYVVEARVGQEWQELAQVTGNYQRLRVHRFMPITAHAIRLRVLATNGDAAARVFEVRCY
jgi:hypothetical protein